MNPVEFEMLMAPQRSLKCGVLGAYGAVHDIFVKKLREAYEESRVVVQKQRFADGGRSVIFHAAKSAIMSVIDPLDVGRYSMRDRTASRKKTDPEIPALKLGNRAGRRDD